MPTLLITCSSASCPIPIGTSWGEQLNTLLLQPIIKLISNSFFYTLPRGKHCRNKRDWSQDSKEWRKRKQLSLTMPSSGKLSKVALFLKDFLNLSNKGQHQAMTWMVTVRFQRANSKLSWRGQANWYWNRNWIFEWGKPFLGGQKWVTLRLKTFWRKGTRTKMGILQI